MFFRHIICKNRVLKLVQWPKVELIMTKSVRISLHVPADCFRPLPFPGAFLQLSSQILTGSCRISQTHRSLLQILTDSCRFSQIFAGPLQSLADSRRFSHILADSRRSSREPARSPREKSRALAVSSHTLAARLGKG